MNHSGYRRLSAVAGTGKTVVLIHRALRLLAAPGSRSVLIITSTDSLAAEVRGAINVRLPLGSRAQRLRVLSLPAILKEWRFSAGEGPLLLDSDAEERAWAGFVDAADQDRNHILHSHHSQLLLKQLATGVRSRMGPTGAEELVDTRRRFWLDHSRALTYLREEISWIVSGLLPKDYGRYVTRPGQPTLPRNGREVRLEAEPRRAVMGILQAWHAWLASRREVDVHLAAGRTLEELVSTTEANREFQNRFAADHVLVDEEQDFGSCEWGILVRLVRRLSEPDALWAAGDPGQSSRMRNFSSSEIIPPEGQGRLDFKGRVDGLRQQYRMTQQVADAGQCLLDAFPEPKAKFDERSLEEKGFGACRDGEFPLVLGPDGLDATVVEMLMAIGTSRTVALIAARASEGDLRLCERLARRAGRTPVRLQRVGGSQGRRDTAVGTIDSIGGCEFDVVFIMHFNALPAPSRPQEEWWRDAAAAYSAMTRARELLVLCCSGTSPFLDALLAPTPRALPFRELTTFHEYIQKLKWTG
jgi:superfamily I DNA/RNA helicase